jgi:hypothetical protein
MIVSAAVFIAMVMALFAVVASPALSPIASIGDWDADGHTNDSDSFPRDGREWADGDGDGVGDNADEFPDDENETSDSDGDGIGDNADFMDGGDAGIRITLDVFEFLGYEENYVRTRYNPNAWFKVYVDLDGDGSHELVGDSGIFNATRSLSDFFSFTVDVRDDDPSVGFNVRAYDVWEVSANNVTDYETMDYWPVSDIRWADHSVVMPIDETWWSDGNGDDDTPDCYLKYSAEAVLLD